MSEQTIQTGAEAAGKLLDSGHLVVTVFIFNTAILIVAIVWLVRLWRAEREETIRLTHIVVDMQAKMIDAIKDWKDQIETLTRALLNGNTKRP